MPNPHWGSLSAQSIGAVVQTVNRDEAAEALRREIEIAFRDFPYPGDDHLDHHFDPSERAHVRRIFTGKRWMDFKDRPMEVWGRGYRMILPFMSPGAFCHFLPLFMLSCIFEYEAANPLGGHLISMLTRRDEDVGLSADYDSNLQPLSRRQLDAVLTFLRFMLVNSRHDGEVWSFPVAPAIRSVESYVQRAGPQKQPS